MNNNYTISQSYKLPSLGKIYEQEFDPNVTIRSMTTAEEMRRLAPSEFSYKNMCQIIDDCIIEDLPISCYDMCIGDYQYLMHKVRCVTYGKEYPLIYKCKYCGCQSEETIDLESFEINQYNDDMKKDLEFDLPVTKRHVTLNIQTPHTLDIVEEKVKEYKKRHKGKLDCDPTIVFLIISLIKTVDGKKPDPINVEEWVKKLPMRDTNTILAHANRFNSGIGVNINMTMLCDVCGLEQDIPFVPNQEFFRPSLDI